MKIIKEVYKKGIDELCLSTRATNCLKRNNFTTIEDILDRQSELYKLRGAGVKTVHEIKREILKLQARVRHSAING